MIKLRNPYQIIAITLMATLFLPYIFSEGMFFDGLTYSSIARNLALGKGSCFELFYTESIKNPFYEHPPLGIWMQVPFFIVLGEYYLTEKIYSLLCFIAFLFLYFQLSRLLQNDDYKNAFWRNLIFYLPIPVVTWCWSNNLLENSMILFMLASSIFSIKAVNGTSWNAILSGFFILLAWFCKGPTALSVITIPFLFSLFYRNFEIPKLIFIYILIFASAWGLMKLLFFIFPAWEQAQNIYLETQLYATLDNNREITTTHNLFIFTEALQQLIIPVILSILLFITSKKIELNRAALFALTFASMCVIPLSITLKQRIFYAAPAFPFYAIFFSEIGKNSWDFLKLEIVDKWIIKKTLPIIALGATVISFCLIGTPIRDKEVIQEAKELKAKNVGFKQIEAEEAERGDWKRQAYLMRYAKVSLVSQKVSYLRELGEKEGESLEETER